MHTTQAVGGLRRNKSSQAIDTFSDAASRLCATEAGKWFWNIHDIFFLPLLPFLRVFSFFVFFHSFVYSFTPSSQPDSLFMSFVSAVRFLLPCNSAKMKEIPETQKTEIQRIETDLCVRTPSYVRIVQHQIIIQQKFINILHHFVLHFPKKRHERTKHKCGRWNNDRFLIFMLNPFKGHACECGWWIKVSLVCCLTPTTTKNVSRTQIDILQNTESERQRVLSTYQFSDFSVVSHRLLCRMIYINRMMQFHNAQLNKRRIFDNFMCSEMISYCGWLLVTQSIPE